MNVGMIGVTDSGIGGFSVLRALQQTLPRENFLYFADTAYSPYGEKSPEELLARTERIMGWMAKQKVTLLVLACHTSSAVLQNSPLSIMPYMTMLAPTLQAVLSHAYEKGLGIWATPLSIKKKMLETLLRQHNFPYPITPLSCPDLAPLIEARRWEEACIRAQGALSFFQQHPVDVIVHGCTHYPLLEPYLKGSFSFLDPAFALAQSVKTYLQNQGTLNTTGQGSLQLCCSGPTQNVMDFVTSSLNAPYSWLTPSLS
jgi:glutamate racemase